MSVIYLEGPEGGIRTAYNETEAAAHEKDGFVRVDLVARFAAKPEPEVKKTRKKRKSND